MSVYDHLQAVREQTGRTPPELMLPEVHPAGFGLLSVFRELHAARGSNGFGPSRIGHRDIEAWCALSGVRLSHWEVETLLAMDVRTLNVITNATKD